MTASSAMAAGEHHAVRELLPFYVNRTLSELEQARVTRHLAQCASCHAEAEEQRQLASVIRAAPEWPANVEASWLRLEQRLDNEQPSRPFATQLNRAPRVWTRMAWPMGLAAAAAAVLLLVPLWIQERSSHDPAYRTLSSTPDSSAAAAFRVVFSPQATAGEIRELLDRMGYQIISGPSPRGVYALAPSVVQADNLDATLAELRGSPLVALAEPIASTGAEP